MQRSKSTIFALVENQAPQTPMFRALGGAQLRAGLAPWDGPEIEKEAAGTSACVLFSLLVAADLQEKGIGSLLL
jgi:hypothetical protein